MNVGNRTIFCHDNLEVLRGINSGCVDLIYADPPFNKKKVFTAPIGSAAEGASFKDIFTQEDVKEEWLETIKEDWDDIYSFLMGIRDIEGRTSYNFCYLAYMAVRLIECHRILKNTGSLYLHCDPTMSHYLKILLDCIFEEKNFCNEIVWQRNDKRAKGSQFKSKKFGANTDTILFYTKSNNYFLNTSIELNELSLDFLKKFNQEDGDGRRYYTGIPLFRSKSMGSRPNLCYEWKGFKNPYPSGWRLSMERLQEEYEKGNVVITKAGKVERRKYLDEYEGNPLDNNWTDIPRVIGRESVGYPTQKPLALLERIIRASSNEGDMVLDPFCGCATTCVAAERLKRKWVGIDVSVKAYELVKQRLAKDVEREGELFHEKLVNFSTTPPKRTDQEPDYLLQKYVYIISHPKYAGEYKIGIASDVKNRLGSYQTSDPNREYKLEYSCLTPYFREIEAYIHEKYENKHEWVRGELKDIQRDIEDYRHESE